MILTLAVDGDRLELDPDLRCLLLEDQPRGLRAVPGSLPVQGGTTGMGLVRQNRNMIRKKS